MVEKTEEKVSIFEQLVNVNVNDHVEKKNAGGTELTYLSWAWAWKEAKTRCPDIEYEIVRQPDGLPYVYDPNTGYMVFTKVQVEDMVYPMWLPVMDSNNRAMKMEPYEVTFKSGKSIYVQAATMMDINKAIMRCLVKNIAVATGIGLYIYAGEDLPEEVIEEKVEKKKTQKKTQKKEESNPSEQSNSEEDPEYKKKKEAYQDLIKFCTEHKIDVVKICEECNVTKDSGVKAFEIALEHARVKAMTEGK